MARQQTGESSPEANADSQDHSALILSAAAMSECDIYAWLDAGLPGDDPQLIEVALQWSHMGFDLASAAEWAVVEDWVPDEALRWHLAGFTPVEASYATKLINHAFETRLVDAPTPSTYEEWTNSTLTPLWVCQCLTAGIVTVEEAEARFSSTECPRLVPALCVRRPSVETQARELAYL